MVNITHKSNTLRIAVASALVTVSKQSTIDAIEQRRVPKGDIYEFARAAGLLAIKKTSDVIPDCHPLPVEYSAIRYETVGLSIRVFVEVHTIYKTGVEVEAMHGASVVALTMYDMLKPIDKGVVIEQIRLETKSGGKTDKETDFTSLKAGVIVCSDSVAAGTSQDASGRHISAKLSELGIETARFEVVPDDVDQIRELAASFSADGIDLLLLTGGTGLSPRDVTPQAIQPLLTQEIPGIMEEARRYGQERMPYAMLSRGVAGFVNETLVITLPGSVRGVEETMAALFPQVLHLFRVKEGKRHD